MTCIQVTR
jgi:hypothetical protein